jgi:hypothetical protein
MRHWIVGSLLAIGILAASSPARAAIITVNVVDNGSYNEFGEHTASNINYIAGLAESGCHGLRLCEYRNWFVFDLAGVSGTIVSASLRLRSSGFESPVPGQFGQQGTETYTLFDVTTPIASLTAGGTGLVGTFNDLGSGTAYGNRTYSKADELQVREIALQAAGVNALQAALGGQFALGGAITTIDHTNFFEHVFGGSFGLNAQLVLDVEPVPVPEPATLALVGFGLAAAVVRRRRASK